VLFSLVAALRRVLTRCLVNRFSCLLILPLSAVAAFNCVAQSPDSVDSVPPLGEPSLARPAEPVNPIIPFGSPILPANGPSTGVIEKTTGIDWSALLRESFAFLAVEQGFRYVTEEGTRHSHMALLPGYAKSLNGLHGWADGDPFIVNYVGHPMQGAVTGFLFAQNDRKYRYAEFGKNSWYWKSRLRATAYSWAYSEQFEIGLLSEAMIGHTQASFPQQGFVDHVATPTIGLAWMIVEDALDKYVIRKVEERTRNGVVRMLVRGGLNPSRSMANIMSFDVPWHRNDRMDPWEPPRDTLWQVTPARVHGVPESHPLIAPFEFTLNTRVLQGVGANVRGSCVGGGATVAFRVSPAWQIAGDVGGCKLTPFDDNGSGDSLTYMVGPRWTPNADRQWEPFAQLLIGGRTITHEMIDREKKAEIEAALAAQGKKLDFPDHNRYAIQTENTGLAVMASAGVDVRVNPAIAFRVVDLGYMHSWHAGLDGINYSNSVQLTAGLIVRLGTW
jgi:hypothetical protein